ncbi:MAG: TrkA C-terminal domain-containing protein, partial [Phycisphaerales bacterium]|nr:TrkA C-terminal domain-containing protein [Phycisphaerales bacterium]
RARPDVYLLARTRYVSEIEILRRLGADQVIPEEYETSIEIFAQVLKELGIPDNVIEQQITMIRAGGYGMLRGRPADHAARIEWLRLLDTAATQPFLLPARSPFVGRTIRETGLRARTGVTIVAVTRAGRPLGNPDPEFQLQAGDVLVLVGRHMQLEQARQWLDPEHGRLPDEGDALTV